MTYDQIHKNITDELYEQPWDPQAHDGFGGWGEFERDFRVDLAQYAESQGVQNVEAIKRMIDVAWQNGHSSGHGDVLIYFEDLLPIAQSYEDILNSI